MSIVSCVAVDTIQTKTRARYVYEMSWVVWEARGKTIHDVQSRKFCPFVFVMEDRTTTIEVCKKFPPFMTEGVKTLNKIALASDLIVLYPDRREFVTAVKSEYRRVGKLWKPPRRLFGVSEFVPRLPPVEAVLKNEEELERILSVLESRAERREEIKRRVLEREFTELQLQALVALREVSFSIPEKLLSSVSLRSPILQPLAEEEKERLERFRKRYSESPQVLVAHIPVRKRREKTDRETEREEEGKAPPPQEESGSTLTTGETEEKESPPSDLQAPEQVRIEERPHPPEEEKTDEGKEEETEKEAGNEKESEEGKPEEEEPEREEEEEKTQAKVRISLSELINELLISFFGFAMGRAFRSIPFNSELIFQKTRGRYPTTEAFLDVLEPGEALDVFLNLERRRTDLLRLFRYVTFSVCPPELRREEDRKKLEGELGDLPKRLTPFIGRVYEKYLRLYRKERSRYRYAILVVKVAKAYSSGKLLDVRRVFQILFPEDFEEETSEKVLPRTFLMMREALGSETSGMLRKGEGGVWTKSFLLERLKHVIVIEPSDGERSVLVPENHDRLLFEKSVELSKKREVSSALHADGNHFRAFLKLLLREVGEEFGEPLELLLKDDHRFRDRLIIPSLFEF